MKSPHGRRGEQEEEGRELEWLSEPLGRLLRKKDSNRDNNSYGGSHPRSRTEARNESSCPDDSTSCAGKDHSASPATYLGQDGRGAFGTALRDEGTGVQATPIVSLALCSAVPSRPFDRGSAAT